MNVLSSISMFFKQRYKSHFEIMFQQSSVYSGKASIIHFLVETVFLLLLPLIGIRKLYSFKSFRKIYGKAKWRSEISAIRQVSAFK